VFAVAALTVGFTGPGSLSVDARYSDILREVHFGVWQRHFVGVLGEVMSLVRRHTLPTQ
jgi:hypothetical protein